MGNNGSTRIIKNTFALYVRMFVYMLLSLYSTRVVLNILGVEDFGIFQAVSSVVMLCWFVNGAIMSSTQRFFSYALGKNDQDECERLFVVVLLIYILVVALGVVLLETIGRWFVDVRLKLPAERIGEARVLFHLLVAGFVFNLLAAPFSGIMIAREHMTLYAYVSIADAVLKLAAILALNLIHGARLTDYGWTSLAASVIVAALYVAACCKRYPECRPRNIRLDWQLFRRIGDFTGWLLFGQFAYIVRNQAVTVLTNQLFSPVVVAARVLAMNVANTTGSFANNFGSSLAPPIVKNYAAGDMEGMHELVVQGVKICFFLMWLICLPLFFEIEFVLGVWLKLVPDGTALFTRLAMVGVIADAVGNPLGAAVYARGRVRWYEAICGVLQIAIFPASWLALRHGGEPYIIFVVNMVFCALVLVFRIWTAHRLIGLPLRAFSYKALAPVFAVAGASVLLTFAIRSAIPRGVFGSLAVMGSGAAVSTVLMFYLGMDRIQRRAAVAWAKKKWIERFSA